MNKADEKTKLGKAYKGIFKALVGLKNSQAICALEMAKTDIILNDSLIVLDGKSGGLTSKINKFKK